LKEEEVASICLGDKFNMILTTNSKIKYWGNFSNLIEKEVQKFNKNYKSPSMR
jgi:hypothetical protein